ncbi:MAG: type I-C CRISPR-associated protein Cas8c/Csd1 [Ruthenibacterium sp.]
MILQALVAYYEMLAKKGEISRSGWGPVKVSCALEIDANGQLLQAFSLKDASRDGKKMVPRNMTLPAPVKRTVGVSANFLCDTASYFLGLDDKGKPERTQKCFEAAQELHHAILSECNSPCAKAICSFFEQWDTSAAKENPALTACMDDLMQGGNLVFLFENTFAQDDADIADAWQRHYDGSDAENGETMRCLVTGKRVAPALTHPPIKGVRDAQSSGAALISFNAPADCSYGREQNANAPVGTYAAFAYTTALNHLLAQRDADGRPLCSKQVGDTTVVYWAEDAAPQYQNVFSAFLDGADDSVTSDDLHAFMTAMAEGKPANWNNVPLQPDNHFYVLGLAPNAARLSVRFFEQDTFGTMTAHIKAHFDRLAIVSDGKSKWIDIPLWALLRETVNENARVKMPSPQMAGDMLTAILTGGRYPATLFQQTQLRIRADRQITRGRAAIIKAYLMRNTNNEEYKEVLNVNLNDQTTYQPYILGRLFSVLEAIQQRANPGINTTIKDKYFSSACATPAMVFPTLLNLADKHLKKMDTGSSIYYAKQLGTLTALIIESYPVHQTLPDQGIFQLGYYHQTQKRYEKKVENKEEN